MTARLGSYTHQYDERFAARLGRCVRALLESSADRLALSCMCKDVVSCTAGMWHCTLSAVAPLSFALCTSVMADLRHCQRLQSSQRIQLPCLFLLSSICLDTSGCAAVAVSPAIASNAVADATMCSINAANTCSCWPCVYPTTSTRHCTVSTTWSSSRRCR